MCDVTVPSWTMHQNMKPLVTRLAPVLNQRSDRKPIPGLPTAGECNRHLNCFRTVFTYTRPARRPLPNEDRPCSGRSHSRSSSSHWVFRRALSWRVSELASSHLVLPSLALELTLDFRELRALRSVLPELALSAPGARAQKLLSSHYKHSSSRSVLSELTPTTLSRSLRAVSSSSRTVALELAHGGPQARSRLVLPGLARSGSQASSHRLSASWARVLKLPSSCNKVLELVLGAFELLLGRS